MLLVNGNINQDVKIDPKEVIRGLIEKEIGYNATIIERDGKYYKMYEDSAGCHSITKYEEISEKKYNYLVSLENVLFYLDW